MIQSLTQRVTELEEALDSKNKTIASLNKQVQDLRSEHDQLKINHESFRDEATSRFSRYDANHKLTSDMFKRVESDFTEFRNVQSKTNDEIKRLARVSSTCQKQISAISPNKTYANAVSEQTKASPTSPDRNVKKNADECRNAPKTSSFKTINETIAEKIHSIRVDNPNSQDSGVGNISSVPKSSTPDRTPTSSLSGDDPHVHKSNGTVPKQVIPSRSDEHNCVVEPCADKRDSAGGSTTNRTARAVQYNGDSCIVTIDRHSRKGNPRHEDDVFTGVTYKKSSRYYISGISKESTRYGIENYIERKGVKVSHLVLFKPKYGGPFLSAKVNVSPQFADTVESSHFWPDGVKCRRWLSNREWELKYFSHEAEEPATRVPRIQHNDD